MMNEWMYVFTHMFQQKNPNAWRTLMALSNARMFVFNDEQMMEDDDTPKKTKNQNGHGPGG
jgi:hypothetical protein